MFEPFTSALVDLLAVQHLIYMAIGVVLGLAVGILPGLGGIVGLAMLLPFIYGMDTTSALGMLIGLVAVIPTSDTFASVLLGIPGSTSSQATVLDGFPMSRKGEASRALASAFSSSLFGGIVGAIVLTGFVLIARPLILFFGSAELFMLTIFGLSMVGVLSGHSLTKGLSACCLGLVLGAIGGAPATGEFRMVYGVSYLYDGLPLVVIALGLFAVPEIVDLLRRDQPISTTGKLGAGWVQGLIDWWRNRFLSFRCAILGSVLGAIPGLGGSVIDWLAYGHAVQSSKDSTGFGHGDVRGVIAPESANNAKEGGAVLPTVMFGIPGSGSMAIFLGGMALIGIEPGPSMADADLDLTYQIIWSLALANVLGAGICVLSAQPIARLTTVPFKLLAPFMIVIICFAAFQATRSFGDLMSLLAIGVLGTLMRRFGWSRPALLIGFVISSQSETYLYQSTQFYGSTFWMRPGALIILAVAAVSVYFGLKSRVRDTETDTFAKGDQMGAASPPAFAICLPQLVFSLVVAGVFLIAILNAAQFSFLGRVFPTFVGVAGLLCVSLLVYQFFAPAQRGSVSRDTEMAGNRADGGTGPLWWGMMWIAGIVGLIALLGFFLAIVAFVPLFLTIYACAGVIKTLVFTVCIAIFLPVLANLLGMRFPDGVLQTFVNLPWPLG